MCFPNHKIAYCTNRNRRGHICIIILQTQDLSTQTPECLGCKKLHGQNRLLGNKVIDLEAKMKKQENQIQQQKGNRLCIRKDALPVPDNYSIITINLPNMKLMFAIYILLCRNVAAMYYQENVVVKNDGKKIPRSFNTRNTMYL